MLFRSRPGLEDVAGPTASPVEAKEIVASGATAASHMSRPRQAPLGPRRFASVLDFGVPIVGPGATVGTVKTRVPRAGLPGLATYSEIFAKDQALQAWRGSPSLERPSMPGEASPRVFLLARDLTSRGHQAKGLARPPASRGFLPRQASSVSSTGRTWALRPPQSRRRGCAW